MARPSVNIEEVLADRVGEGSLLEVPLPDRAFRALFTVTALVSLLLFVDLVHLGSAKRDLYAARALANARDVSIDPAPRGIIRDRFGTPLVKNEPSYNVFLVPRAMPEDARARADVVAEIGKLLNFAPEDLAQRLERKDWSVSDRLFLTNELTHDQLLTLSSQEIPGVAVEPGLRRAHEMPFVFSHLVGYTGLTNGEDLRENPILTAEDEVGRAGLEASYDAVLRGVNGERIAYRDARGKVAERRTTRLPAPGRDLVTSIDAPFQKYFYARLERALRELGRTVGVGIAMDPRNGEILALVGVPGFDATKIAEFLTRPNEPLFNRALSGLYNPGSTIKPLHAVAALTEGVIAPQTKILSTGYIEVPNPYDPGRPSRFLDYKPQGWVDVYVALAKSSNVYFYEVMGGFEEQRGVGILKLREWWKRFGLGEPTRIDLVGEKSGFLPDPTWKEEKTGEPWRVGDTYNVAIGQGDLLVTPLGLLNYVSAIANGGILYEPSVVRRALGADGEALTVQEPVVLRDLREVIGEAVPHVQRGMRDAVRESYGTAHYLATLPFAVAAKTGTAQVANNEKLNAFFVGYAPAERPEIAIIILVENAREGSLNTVPVAHDVFLWYYENRIKGSAER